MILFIEILAIIITLILAILWAINPTGNYEPFIVISAGSVASFLEIYRRISSNKKDEEKNTLEIQTTGDVNNVNQVIGSKNVTINNK